MTTQEIVSKLWNLCNVLRDDGITYHQYVTELTYILFLKMAKETDKESKFAEGITLQDVYKRQVVDHVDYLIAYTWHPASNARELVEYARKRQRNLCLSITLIKPDN